MAAANVNVFSGLIGYVDKKVNELSNDNCVVNFTVAETPRVKKNDQWVDAPTIWTNVSIFGDEARNFIKSVKPGTPVTVIGRRDASEFMKDGEKQVRQSIVASQVAVSITKFNYIKETGNINYAKEGRSGKTNQGGKKEDNFLDSDDGLFDDGDDLGFDL